MSITSSKFLGNTRDTTPLADEYTQQNLQQNTPDAPILDDPVEKMDKLKTEKAAAAPAKRKREPMTLKEMKRQCQYKNSCQRPFIVNPIGPGRTGTKSEPPPTDTKLEPVLHWRDLYDLKEMCDDERRTFLRTMAFSGNF